MKLKRLALSLLCIFALSVNAYAQSTSVSIEQLPIRTLTHVVGHDNGGHAGREPVTDFVKPATTSPGVGNFATWGSGGLITDGGTPGSMAFQNSGAVSITGGSITGITDLAIGDGGTGSSTASGARTNLGLGTAATQNTGTSGATVPLLNGNNQWTGTATFGSAASAVSSFNVAGSSTVRGIANTTALFGAGIASGSVTGANVQLGSINGNSPFIAGSLYGVSDATASDLLFMTNATERMRILAGGNLQMASNQAITFSGTGAGATRSNLGAAASGANSDITSLTGMTTPLGLAYGGTASGTVTGARTNLGAAASGANGDITSLTGLTTPLSIAQGGTAGATASAARTNLGLTSAATATATVGGSWTPVLAFGGGSTGITYSVQSGTYQRIGPLIYVTFTITLTAKGSSTGTATISGLPFVASSPGSILIAAGSNFATSNPTFAVIAASSSVLTPGITGTTGPIALTDANFTNTTSLTMSGVYTNGAF